VAWDINKDEPKFSVKEMFFTNVGMVEQSQTPSQSHRQTWINRWKGLGGKHLRMCLCVFFDLLID
jgi:hypothetical protein